MPTTVESDETSRRSTPRLASDNLRSTVASLVTAVITLAATFLGGYLAARAGLEREDVVGLRTNVLVYFGFWIGYSLIFMLMTWRVFHRADAKQLRSWLHESTSARRARRMREALSGGSGPVGAVSFTTVAVVAVVVVAVLPALRRDPLVVGMAVGVVAVSWLLLVAAYAVHYAREDVRTGELEFAGDVAPTLHDYLYLAVQMSTTFSASDVTITGTAMRRTASAHAIVAFTFNTVIIALLVSVLITGIG